MKLLTLRKSRTQPLPGIAGVARLDRRTKSIVKRLRPGDIAIIDHVDIDRAAAVAIAEARVAAVVNVAPSVSGRYPNLGPQVLIDAGIVLVDDVTADVFTGINEGELIRIDGDTLYRGETALATGDRQDAQTVERSLEASKAGMTNQLEALSANAVEHLRRERDLLLDGVGVPSMTAEFIGRQALVVLRAFDYRADLASLKTYIRENSPVLIGVDAGADALLEAGHRPEVIVTAGEDISDAALRCGAEVVAHTGPDGRVLGADRLEGLGVNHATFVASGTTEDAALLLAYAHKSELIVMVGSHSSLLEFLDKGRSGMASSFLTRTTVGSKLVDAKAVAPLYQHRVRGWLVALLMLFAVALVVLAIAATPVGQDWWDQVKDWGHAGYTWSRGQLP